ncbi:hypothetical protein GF312_18330 [Candidatus Poribacteria bacterium]|nr:hypothetical protein [Candidatus Poribacteria bacterium]
MPTYEYKCNNCGEVREVLHLKTSDMESISCPDCGSGDMKRLISAANVSTKGKLKSGVTCCGQDERCSKPPCEDGRCIRN